MNLFEIIWSYLVVSWNRGTPKSSILLGFSTINQPFWGSPIYGNPHLVVWEKSTSSYPVSLGHLLRTSYGTPSDDCAFRKMSIGLCIARRLRKLVPDAKKLCRTYWNLIQFDTDYIYIIYCIDIIYDYIILYCLFVPLRFTTICAICIHLQSAQGHLCRRDIENQSNFPSWKYDAPSSDLHASCRLSCFAAESTEASASLQWSKRTPVPWNFAAHTQLCCHWLHAGLPEWIDSCVTWRAEFAKLHQRTNFILYIGCLMMPQEDQKPKMLLTLFF